MQFFNFRTHVFFCLLPFQHAVNINQRPFLHFTTIPILMMLLMVPAFYWFHSFRFNLWLCTVSCAFFAHHIRDATRRGLTLWPFGTTKPLPYPLYIGCIIVIPFVLAKWLCCITNTTNNNQSRHNSTVDILTI